MTSEQLAELPNIQVRIVKKDGNLNIETETRELSVTARTIKEAFIVMERTKRLWKL